jgi:hypothetical protein
LLGTRGGARRQTSVSLHRLAASIIRMEERTTR